MHSKLLHEALQKEETRAIVIEVEEGPEEPGEDEEFYAANFKLLGHEDEDEEEGMVSEDEAPPLVDSDEELDEEPPPFAYLGEDRPRLCQQRVPLEVNGNLTSLHTLYDWESPNTLVRNESARRIGLQGVRAPRQAIKGYQGEGCHRGQRVLPTLAGRGRQYPGDSCAWSGRDSSCRPYEAAPCSEGDLPCHPGIHALDEDWGRARGVAHRIG